MKTFYMILLVAAATAPAAVSAENPTFNASASAIRNVVSGKTCIGKDILTFGENITGTAGTFQRAGRPIGTYNIGHGTIMIRRNEELHGHVTSVSEAGRMLYMSAGAYRCETSSSGLR